MNRTQIERSGNEKSTGSIESRLAAFKYGRSAGYRTATSCGYASSAKHVLDAATAAANILSRLLRTVPATLPQFTCASAL